MNSEELDAMPRGTVLRWVDGDRYDSAFKTLVPLVPVARDAWRYGASGSGFLRSADFLAQLNDHSPGWQDELEVFLPKESQA